MGTIFLVINVLEEAVPMLCTVMAKGDSLYLGDIKNVEVVLQDYSLFSTAELEITAGHLISVQAKH